MRRITISLDEALERALDEAAERLGLEDTAADAVRLLAYARLGYEHTLEEERDRERLATYRAWIGAPEMGKIARAASRRAARRGVYED
jgi:metal-responsive CopG/Arc/MetJ family transcriptional regulator